MAGCKIVTESEVDLFEEDEFSVLRYIEIEDYLKIRLSFLLCLLLQLKLN
jgi:hypothetical protein